MEQDNHEIRDLVNTIKTQHPNKSDLADELVQLARFPGVAWAYIYKKSEVPTLQNIFFPVLEKKFGKVNQVTGIMKEHPETKGYFGLQLNFDAWKKYFYEKVSEILSNTSEKPETKKIHNADNYFSVAIAMLNCAVCSNWNNTVVELLGSSLGLTSNESKSIIQENDSDASKKEAFEKIINALTVNTKLHKDAVNKLDEYFTVYGKKPSFGQINGLRHKQATWIKTACNESPNLKALITLLLHYESMIPKNSHLNQLIFEAILHLSNTNGYIRNDICGRQFWFDMASKKISDYSTIKLVYTNPFVTRLSAYIEEKRDYGKQQVRDADRICNKLIKCLLDNPNDTKKAYKTFLFNHGSLASSFVKKSRITKIFDGIKEASEATENNNNDYEGYSK